MRRKDQLGIYTEVIVFRVTENHKQTLSERAQNLQLTLSELIRQILLGDSSPLAISSKKE